VKVCKVHVCSICGKKFTCTNHCNSLLYTKKCRCDVCERKFRHMRKEDIEFKNRCKTCYIGEVLPEKVVFT